MMMHDIFGENLFDDFMNDFAFPTFPAFTTSSMLPAFPDTEKVLYGKHAKNLMKTDIKENEDGYELIIDLPGFKKDELQVSLNDGYLTISAEHNSENDEKDENGKFVYVIEPNDNLLKCMKSAAPRKVMIEQNITAKN